MTEERARERNKNKNSNDHDVRLKVDDEIKQDLQHALNLINSRRKENESQITQSELCREFIRSALDNWFVAERF